MILFVACIWFSSLIWSFLMITFQVEAWATTHMLEITKWVKMGELTPYHLFSLCNIELLEVAIHWLAILNICYSRRCWWTNNVLSRLWKNSRSERSLWKNHSGPTGKRFKMSLFGGWLQFCIQIEILFWNRLFYSGYNNVSLKIHKVLYY